MFITFNVVFKENKRNIYNICVEKIIKIVPFKYIRFFLCCSAQLFKKNHESLICFKSNAGIEKTTIYI